jgi:hypothetical protein
MTPRAPKEKLQGNSSGRRNARGRRLRRACGCDVSDGWDVGWMGVGSGASNGRPVVQIGTPIAILGTRLPRG